METKEKSAVELWREANPDYVAERFGQNIDQMIA